MNQLPEEAINIGALTHANSLLRLWHQEPLTMEQAELMPDWESYREHLKDALTAVYPAIEAQVRAQVAAEIREAVKGLVKISIEIRPGLYERDIRYEGLKGAYTHAARIAEGER